MNEPLFPSNDQENIFLTLDGIPGEVTLSNYADTIAIKQFGYKTSLPMTIESARGGKTTDKSIHTDIMITKVADLSSVKMWEHVCKGVGIAKAKFDFIRFSQGELVTSRTIEIEEVWISSFEHVLEPSIVTDLPLEIITMGFEKITDTYTQQNPDGTMAGNVSFSWDRLNSVPG
jgi:type VI secretion system secreted protein Hcp